MYILRVEFVYVLIMFSIIFVASEDEFSPLIRQLFPYEKNTGSSVVFRSPNAFSCDTIILIYKNFASVYEITLKSGGVSAFFPARVWLIYYRVQPINSLPGIRSKWIYVYMYKLSLSSKLIGYYTNQTYNISEYYMHCDTIECHELGCMPTFNLKQILRGLPLSKNSNTKILKY